MINQRLYFHVLILSFSFQPGSFNVHTTPIYTNGSVIPLINLGLVV
jgi:hypothetical protein